MRKDEFIKTATPILKKIINIICKNGINIFERKRIQLLQMNEDANNVKNNILSGNSPIGTLNWHQIAERTVQVYNGTATVLINNSIAEQQRIDTQITEHFCFEKWQFSIITTKDNVTYIDIVFPDDEHLKNKLIAYMHSEGFYYNDASGIFIEYLYKLLGKEADSYKPNDEEIEVLSHWAFFRFFPYSSKNILEQIKQHTDYLIHLTPQENVDNILNNGILCRNRSHETYPKRIFLVVPNRKDRSDWNIIKQEYPFSKYIQELINRLNKYRVTIEHKFPTFYSAVLININKLKENSLFIDTPSYPYAVFTDKDIKANDIERITTIEELIEEFS